MEREPQEWAERHSPTVKTEVVISHTPRRVKSGPRRRAAEERLWNGFTADETAAAEELGRVWSYITNGMTAKAQQYERLDRGRDNATELAAHLKGTYDRWRMRLRPVERSACIAVLFEGLTITEAARAYRAASAWPRANIGKCLEVWIELRGWA